MLTARLYMLQRLSALIMVPLVLGHLALMIYAIGGGLTADEILDRTQGSMGWFIYYGLFVLAAAVHGAIGLRSVTTEWFDFFRSPDQRQTVNLLMASFFFALFIPGILAVYFVTRS